MEKSRIISISGILAVCALVVTLFYLMSRGTPEAPEPLLAQTPSSMNEQNTELKIEVLTEGTGPEIQNGNTAFMYYVGSLDNGSIFDKNDSGEGFAFLLGAGQVIQGWDLGVLGMKVGEKRRLTIPASLGYGARGYPPVIPENATLHFDVELRAIR
jgi:FKBP-type peptidyl-prolyl cis-trans isomerase FkpA